MPLCFAVRHMHGTERALNHASSHPSACLQRHKPHPQGGPVSTIRTGVYGNHIFLPPSLTQRASQYDVAVGSLIAAEQQGHHWALCADATDSLNPTAGWVEADSDLFRDAPDPNAAFTMEPVIASAAGAT